MSVKPEQEPGEAINKRISEVKEDDTGRSKHRSTASETDCFISETSISEAVVKSVSNESFAVLEAGSTVKLTLTAPLPSKDSVSKDEKEIAYTSESTKAVVTKDADNSSSDKKTPTISNNSVSIEKHPTTVPDKLKDNTSTAEQLKSQSSSGEDAISKESIKNDSVVKETEQNPTTDQKGLAEDVTANREKSKDEPRLSENKIMKKSERKSNEMSASVKTSNGSESSRNDQSNETIESDKKQPSSKNTEESSQAADSKQSVNTDTSVNIQKSESAAKSKGETKTEVKTETVVVAETKSSSQASTSELKEETTQPLSQEHDRNESPEEMAILAKNITTSLAKQKVNSTSAVSSQMIEASTNALTLYNGSTLELADIDYFIIYKTTNPKPSDGVSFIARMELGTHCLTKVIPVGPTRAWVAYSGGAIKLIDTESESALNKIDIQGLDAITTSEESSLFTTTVNTFSIIERLHIVGEGVSGSAPIIRVCKNRIACFTMANSGKNIIVCIEKQHSCLCIPKKSEIVVQLYEMNGKRGKELKPKVNGRHTRTSGFPIVMCENGATKDICIASYNSSDHTCAVEVYDKHMERKFVYDGVQSLSPRFMCEDMCCDKTGNILMLDNSLKSVHIVNSTGRLLKLISTPKFQIENPKCINVDTNGRLWIGQGPPAQMIILEYSM